MKQKRAHIKEVFTSSSSRRMRENQQWAVLTSSRIIECYESKQNNECDPPKHYMNMSRNNNQESEYNHSNECEPELSLSIQDCVWAPKTAS